MGSERHRQSRHPLSEVRCRAYSPAMSRHMCSMILLPSPSLSARKFLSGRRKAWLQPANAVGSAGGFPLSQQFRKMKSVGCGMQHVRIRVRLRRLVAPKLQGEPFKRQHLFTICSKICPISQIRASRAVLVDAYTNSVRGSIF